MEKIPKTCFYHFLDNKKNGEVEDYKRHKLHAHLLLDVHIGDRNGIGKEDTEIPEVPMPEI